MHSFRLALLSLLFVGVIGAAEPSSPVVTPVGGEPAPASEIDVKVNVQFPASEIFGVKLVNGRPTQALLTFVNSEAYPVNVAFIGGSLMGPNPKDQGATSVTIQNITSTRFNVQIPPKEKEVINYSFGANLHPQELRLQLVAVVTTNMGAFYTINAFNETVSIVEPDASFFDPQLIFLYLLLAGLFFGTSYFVYNTWISTLFPQKARHGKGGDRAKRSTTGSKKVDPADQVAVVGGDGPAVTSGAKAFDESWIPEHHLKRPEARRVGSGRPKSRGKPE